jgi:hypothetical protein
MTKSCKEISKDIRDLKEKIQTSKWINVLDKEISDKIKCNSDNAYEVCKNCKCWKVNINERILENKEKTVSNSG